MADSPRGLELLERLLKVIRETLVLVVLAFVVYYIGPHLPRIGAQLRTAQVDQVDLLGIIKLKVQQAEATLEAAVNAQAPQRGPEDQQVSQQTKLVVEALDTLRTTGERVPSGPIEPLATTLPPSPGRGSFWVYLGARRGSTWISRNFDIQEVPTRDTSIRARVDIFKRRHVPVFRTGQWTMGDPVGVLQSGEAVKVLATERVPGTEGRDLWWAEVTAK
jgi:hypothetical protein